MCNKTAINKLKEVINYWNHKYDIIIYKYSKDINLLKRSGFFAYHQGLTFKNSTWRSPCVECFLRISEQTATWALYIIN